MDRATARAYIASKIEDPDQTRFTSDQYNNAIALAEEQFALDAKAIITEASIAMVSGTSEVALPADFIMCVLVRHNGLKLQPQTKYGLSFQSGVDWTTLPAGTPTDCYVNEETESLGLVPAPDDTNAALTLLLNYVAAPAAVTADTQVLLSARALLQHYAPAVVSWASSEMLTYGKMDEDKIIKRSVLLKDYERYVNECISIYNNMVDKPIQMKGGRDWTDGSAPKGGPNAFSSPY